VNSIHRHLHAAGLITPTPQKRPKSSYIRFAAEQPNERWQADFTHWCHATCEKRGTGPRPACRGRLWEPRSRVRGDGTVFRWGFSVNTEIRMSGTSHHGSAAPRAVKIPKTSVFRSPAKRLSRNSRGPARPTRHGCRSSAALRVATRTPSGHSVLGTARPSVGAAMRDHLTA
jgi:hypothetical protein